MAVATSSGTVSPTAASRGAVFTFTIVGALILAGYFGLSFLYDRVKPSPEHIYEALTEAGFDQPLPENLRVTGGSASSRPDERYVSIHLDSPVDPDGFEGNQARITYVVWDDPQRTRQHLQEIEISARVDAQLRATAEGGRSTFGVAHLSLQEENACRVLNGRVDYCQVVVGRVIIDITSHLEMLGIGDDSYEQLAQAALAHLREAVPGVD